MGGSPAWDLGEVLTTPHPRAWTDWYDLSNEKGT
jgi:hypothetical protein